MDTETSSFSHLIAQARAGSEDAARRLVELYEPHILRVIRRRISHEIRSKFDSQDFAQAVWTSFFNDRKAILDADTPERLIGLLATMARNKLVDETRRRMNTQKHDLRRERFLNEMASDERHAAVSHRETPSQVAMAHEHWERLLADQPELYRNVARLKMNGETCEAIGARLGVNERTVRRVLKRISQVSDDAEPNPELL